jgi:hypothetical protein
MFIHFRTPLHGPIGAGWANGLWYGRIPPAEGTQVAHVIFRHIKRHLLWPLAGMEEQVNENRLKTFIKLTRRALEEDRIGQPDFSYRHKLIMNNALSDKKRGREGLTKKS